MTKQEQTLSDALAKRATDLLDQNAPTEDVLELVNAIATIKR